MISAHHDNPRLRVRDIDVGAKIVDPMWHPALPELACVANAVSLMMPHAEPYVVQSVRAALPHLDGALRTRTEQYLRQELRHHVEHRRFNQLILPRYRGAATVDQLVRRAFVFLRRRGGPRFGLAFAAGFEAVAYVSARWTERHLGELFDGADPVAASLFLWHLAEEVEHKDVARDVFDALDGSRLRYAWAMVVSLIVLGVGTIGGSAVLLAGHGRLVRPVALWRLTRWSVSYLMELLPDLAATTLPGHHPRDFVDPTWFALWLATHEPSATASIQPGGGIDTPDE